MSENSERIPHATRTFGNLVIHVVQVGDDPEDRYFEVSRADTGEVLTDEDEWVDPPTDDQIRGILKHTYDLWTCQGCGHQIHANEADAIVDHVRYDCNLVDGTGTPIWET